MNYRFLEVAGLGLTVTAWGLNYPFSLVGLHYAPPVWMAFLRAFSAFLVFYPILRLMKVSVRMGRRKIFIAAAMGIPGSMVFFGFWLIGLESVSPGIASVLVVTYPLWMLFLSIPILGERPGAVKVLAALGGFAGAAIASNVIFEHAVNSILADVELLMAGLGFGLMNIVFKRFFSGKEMLSANFWQLGGSLIPLFLWASFTNPVQSISWSLPLFGAILWVGVLGTSVALAIWFVLLSRYRISSLGVYLFLTVIIAFVGSFFMYHEVVQWIQVAGILLIIVSIYTVNRGDRKDVPETVESGVKGGASP